MTTTEGPGRSDQPGQREAARAHVTQLRQDGGTYRSIAAAAALSTGSVHRLASGRRRAQPGTAAAVLTVTSPALPQARLDAGGTRLRLRALHVMGHGSARIARAIGVHPVTIRKIVRGDARTVSQHLRDAIADLYDAWWDKRAPGRTRFERAAATAARKRAMTGNWCAAAALDDDRLDIPGYRPEYGWKPATGTGVAPDIRARTAATAGGRAAHDQRRPFHVGIDPRRPRRTGTPRLPQVRRPAHRPGVRHDPRPRLRLRRRPRDPPWPGSALATSRASTARPRSRPGRHHPHSRRGQHRLRRGGHRRRRQALPHRDVPRLPRPVLSRPARPTSATPKPSTR